MAYHDPTIEGAPGHGEGHNSVECRCKSWPRLLRSRLWSASICKAHLRYGLELRKRFFGTRAHLVKAGVFKDVDVVPFAHVGTNFGVAYGPTGESGVVSLEYLFQGRAPTPREYPNVAAITSKS